jgi:metal-responsive CopG/Arc/MetJ family transcriptional regulator
MSRATITLPSELLDELMRVVTAKSKTEAAVIAIKEEIRLKNLEKIKGMAGAMEFVSTAEELRHGDARLG